MPYSILREAGYLVIAHRGDITADEVRKARAEALQALSTEDPRRLLIDWREVSQLPRATELYFIVDETRPAKGKRARCAVLASTNRGASAKFLEDAARNRGLQIKAFIAHDPAIEWLLSTSNED